MTEADGAPEPPSGGGAVAEGPPTTPAFWDMNSHLELAHSVPEQRFGQFSASTPLAPPTSLSLIALFSFHFTSGLASHTEVCFIYI